MNCPRCQGELSDAASCPSCGFSFDDATQRLEHPSDSSGKPSAKSGDKRSLTSLDSIDDARFVPGTILADRYRIVGLLGKGGMGEVYRADDLKLAHPVALKFLPDHLMNDSAALARFHREVRVARQVSHKNVCRVYDIGEIDGRLFLSMEFIKGEELSSLLRRIGRLPQDKALQLARQICAGLAAAHDIGFLHRDLKPANIMIDADGNARILDFGLAGLTDEFAEEEIRAGTPAYMSPEQIEGGEQSIQSDVYSLGLVLYELFTGKRAFEAPSLQELIKLRRSDTAPTNPTSLVKDLDPAIEKVIDRCLQKKPEDRPASALQVAAALPGGDPLAAALAAGETPSPEMVAAAPTEGVLRPAVALGLFGAFIVLLAASCWLTKFGALNRLAPLNQSPEVLRARAREIIARFGYHDPVLDRADGVLVQRDYLNYVEATDRSPNRWERLRTENAQYRFWYRESPRYFETAAGEVEADHPALDVSGMTTLYLDMDGRLHWFRHVPPQRETSPVTQQLMDWSSMFREAGLDINAFQKVASTWIPLHAYDERVAWDGADPLHPDQKLHVEAASLHGRPVYFETTYPWDLAARQEQLPQSGAELAFVASVIAVFMIALIGSALIARHNLRLGRGDIRGALRVAFVLFIARIMYWLFGTHHSGTVEGEFLLLLYHLSLATFYAFYIWLLYIALEPFIRRRWPHRIISWSRLLRGEFRDPLVGRDILIGAVWGGVVILAMAATPAILRGLGKPFGLLTTNPGNTLIGAHFLTRLKAQVTAGLFLSLIMFFLLLLAVIILRNEWVALGIVLILNTLLGTLVAGGYLTGIPGAALSGLIMIVVLYRYGLLALSMALFFAHLWVFYPMTTELGAWYAIDFVIAASLLVALAAFACYTSMAGQRLFGGKLLED